MPNDLEVTKKLVTKQGSTTAKKQVDQRSESSSSENLKNNPSIEGQPSTDREFTKDEINVSISVASQADKQDDDLVDP